MIPKDMKLAIQILDKLEDDEIGMLNDMMKWKAEKIFEDVELIVRTVAGDFGETPIFKEYQKMKRSHLSNYEPIGSSLNKDYVKLRGNQNAEK